MLENLMSVSPEKEKEFLEKGSVSKQRVCTYLTDKVMKYLDLRGEEALLLDLVFREGVGLAKRKGEEKERFDMS